MKGEFKADKQLGDDGDTINIHVKAPYEVKLGYKFFLDVDREYCVVPVLNKFDAGVDGKYCYVKFSEVEHWGFDGSLF